MIFVIRIFLILGFAHHLTLATEGSSKKSQNLFLETHTLDGVKVFYIPLSSEQMEMKRQSVAFTSYIRKHASLFYDSELFARLSYLPKFIIIEHERAHHYLGHSYSTKQYRERKEPVPNELTIKKEEDADCAAGYRLKQEFPKTTRAEIHKAVLEVFEKRGGNPEKAPPWIAERSEWIADCFDGKRAHPEFFTLDAK